MAIVNQIRTLFTKINITSLTKRPYGYKSSLFLEDVQEPITTKYEVTKNPDEWKFVERVLPPIVVPEPVKKDMYPSGWKPQGEAALKQPYYIARTKNHMLPIYMQVKQNGVKRLTMIKKITGDIWLLSEDIKNFLQKDTPRPIRMQVNEFTSTILISGDHVNAVKYYLEKKEF